MPDLSIIIVSWNTKQLLQECLESLYCHTKGITFEVFVVDNNSSDGSPEMVRTLFPQVGVIANDHNAGFSKANNQAIRISKGRYIALLNPDTLLIEDVFTPLIRYADQHEKIGAIGPKIFCRDGKRYNMHAPRNYRISISHSVIQPVSAIDLRCLIEQICLTGIMRILGISRPFAGLHGREKKRH